MSDKDYIMALLYDPFGYEQAMYDMNRRVEKVLSKYFPYNTSTYKDVRGLMASLTKGGTLDADTINSIHRDVLSYMLLSYVTYYFPQSPMTSTVISSNA